MAERSLHGAGAGSGIAAVPIRLDEPMRSSSTPLFFWLLFVFMQPVSFPAAKAATSIFWSFGHERTT